MKNRSAARWRLFLGCIVTLAATLACAGIGADAEPETSTNSPDKALLRLENGVIEVQAENGDWAPVLEESAFDLTAPLEGTDTWQVAGITLETNDATQIEEGLQVGDLVRARGLILDDGTWLATSIERAGQPVDPIIVLLGKVDSVDPWIVNGIQLNVTPDTEIQGTITPGMFVRVEILLSPDGTWEVLSITPLRELEENPDCGTVVARVVSVEGNVIQLVGWPEITLGEEVRIEDEAGGEATLGPDQAVILVVCPSGEGQVVIVQIIILNIEDTETPTGGGEGGEKVLVCHKPQKKGGHTLSISSSAVPAHMGHGDTMGACP